MRVPYNTNGGRIGRRVLPAIGLAAACIAAPAAAQQIQFLPPIPEETIEPGLKATLSAVGTYDDNIFRTDDDVTPSIDDIIVTPGIDAQYDKALGPHLVRLNGDVRYDYYTQETDRSRLRLDGSAAARISIAGVCRAEPFAQYRRARADYGDINTRIDNIQQFSTLSLQLSCPREAGFFPLARYQRETTRNEEEFDFSNRNSDSYSLGLGYSRPSLGMLTAYYDHNRADRYDIGIVSNVDRYGLTFRRMVVSAVSLELDVHWLDVTTNVPVIEEYHGLAWNAVASIRPNSALLLRFETGRAIVTDSLIASGYAVRSNYHGQLFYALGDRASARIGYQYETRDFRRDPAITFDPVDSDKIHTLTAGLKRAVSARVNLELAGLHVVRETNNQLRDYKANQVTLGASYGF